MHKALIIFLLLIVIPISLVAQEGFIKIQRDKGYQLEIPDSILGRNILFGSRIIDLSEPSAKVYAAGQLRTPPVLIRFSKSGNVLKMEQIVNFYQSNEKDPIYKALERNQKISAVQTFEIDPKNQGSNTSIIDVTKYFSEEVSIAWALPDNVKKGRLDPKLSKIISIKSFGDHVNFRCHYGYVGGREPFSITIQYFMLLLPKEPLRARYNDDRVGYQSINIKKYASGEPIVSREIISRWRIEPKPQDVEKHKAGKLVEPAKPIVVYIEPYFPKDWIPYIKKGVEDWQVAFESIGFKNAIVAKEFPDDPNFDPEDIKINCVRYLPVDEANAAGQIWIDPSTGEIIQGDILWWNNVIELVKMWRFTQTAAVDIKARDLKYSKEMIGEMIRYAIAHETGHMLGLQHNMRSSFAYPVDSLRSSSFTKKFGTTASIMDYARNNHVAQVGDLERGVKMTPPVLGPFDIFSIQYGYKIFYGSNDEQSELAALEKLFRDKRNDPMYLFAPFIASPIPPDPAGQAESLGDDIIKSSTYGIKNTRIILENLKKWTIESGGGEEIIISRYEALCKQYFRYLSLSLSYIGGVYIFPGPIYDNQKKYVPVTRIKQKEALEFVVNELFELDKYLNVKDLSEFNPNQTEAILKKQADLVSSILNGQLLPRVANNEFSAIDKYSLNEYLADIDNLILDENRAIGQNIFAKNIQTTYIQLIGALANPSKRSDEILSGTAALITEAAYLQLQLTKDKLKQIIAKSRTNDSRYYQFLLNLLEKQ